MNNLRIPNPVKIFSMNESKVKISSDGKIN